MASFPVLFIERLWPASQHLVGTWIQLCLLNQDERKEEMEERRVALTSHHMGIKRLQMAFPPEMSSYSQPSFLRDVS